MDRYSESAVIKNVAQEILKDLDTEVRGNGSNVDENTVIGSNAFVTKSVPDKTKVSVKNPELQFKNSDNTISTKDLEQDEFWSYTI